MFDLQADAFTLFGVPHRYTQSLEGLEQTWRTLQAEVHPDKFTQATDAERRLSLQWATRLNEAYQTLKNPLSRAIALVEWAGYTVDAHSNTALPVDFLMAQMEWRENIEAARTAANEAALNHLAEDLKQEKRTLFDALRVALDNNNPAWDTARLLIQKIRFFNRLEEEIETALEAFF